MAEQTETIELDDSALFHGAMADEPNEDSGQPRDEHGRFAPKEADKPAEQVAETKPAEQPVVAATTEQTQTEQPKDDAANVPSWRLKEIREERDAVRKQLEAERQERLSWQEKFRTTQGDLEKLRAPKAEPVDFFADPDAALKQNLDPLRSEFQQEVAGIRLEMSRELAIIRHGEPAVAEMEASIAKALETNHPDIPALRARMNASKNPASVAMEWHKNQKLVQETGGDLTAYKEKLRNELLKDPEFMAKAIESARSQAGVAPQAGRPNINLPPSLNKAAGAGLNNTATEDAADMSDRALFKNALAR